MVDIRRCCGTDRWATFLVSGQAGRALADEEGGLGDKIAGTYLAVMENGARFCKSVKMAT